MLGISVILGALEKINAQPTGLTSIHSDLCKLCLSSRCFTPAFRFLERDFTDLSKEAGLADPKYILLYFYYGGMILTAVKVNPIIITI